jgi:hypothetical protein
MPRICTALIVSAPILLSASSALAELGSNNPSDQQLLTQRAQEAGCDTSTTPPTCPPNSTNLFDSGIFDIAVPPAGTTYQPAGRVKRNKFGVVGTFMLQNGLSEAALDALVYPGATEAEKDALVEGLQFFTMFHTAAQGSGPLANQPACIGCHLNAAEAVRSPGLLQGSNCIVPGSNLPAPNCSNVSNVTRAGRSTPTNFEFTSLDPATGGGVAPDNLDALNSTGRTAAFTNFGDFSSVLLDTVPGSVGAFDPLDGASHTFTTLSFTSQPFGGFVQHHRPAVDACFPKPLPPVGLDTNLTGSNPNEFRRTIGEREGPPYIGRGLMEAVPTDDITANADPAVENGRSSLGNFAKLICPSASSTGCISGAPNMIPRNFAINTTGNNAGISTGSVGGVGRFGLRANGVEILQFIVGGLQGELSFTSLLNGAEIVFPTLFPGGTTEAIEPLECAMALSETVGQPASVLAPPLVPLPVNLDTLEVHLSTPFSIRNLLRNTAPPEFGDALLDVLQSAGGKSTLQNVSWRPDSEQAEVKRGAELFGIDLVAFANRTIGGPMTAGGDGRDDNAINQADRKLNCVGCHTPIQLTGQSPAEVGAENLSHVWAPIFSDLLLHHMPVIDAERFLQSPGNLPRDPLVIRRLANFRFFDTFDVPRNLADDTFSNAKASAEGSQFRTAPLMGLGRIGPPFMHDGRVYLSEYTVNGNASSTGTASAGTVTTNRWQTNAPLVVNSVDSALLAAIELHDLPAPDDRNTPRLPGAGCPVPPAGSTSNIDYGSSPQNVICPRYNSATSQTNRSDAAEVIYRFRELSPDDQQAVIEFLKQL